MNESWHKKVIAEYREEVTKAAITALITAVIFGIVYFALGNHFELREVHLSEPTLTLRILSGLVFDSLGFILYELKFYYALYMVMVVALRMRKANYDAIKKVIWYSLMFIMGFYIVPWIMNVLNLILTILLNVAMIILYIAPSVGIFVAVFFATFYFLRKKNKKEKTEVIHG